MIVSELEQNLFSDDQIFDINPKTIQMSNELVDAVVDKSSNTENNGIKVEVFVEVGVEAEERIDSNDSREEAFHDLTPDVNHFAAEEMNNQRSDLIQSLKVSLNDQGYFLKVIFC